jgi:hypothetical protein
MKSAEARMHVITVRWGDGTEMACGPFESQEAALAATDELSHDTLDGEPPEIEIVPLFTTGDRLVSIVRYHGQIPNPTEYVREQAETQFRVNEHEADGLFTGYDGWTVTT